MLTIKTAILLLLLTGCTTAQFEVRHTDNGVTVTMPRGGYVKTAEGDEYDDRGHQEQPGVLHDLLGIMAIKEVD